MGSSSVEASGMLMPPNNVLSKQLVPTQKQLSDMEGSAEKPQESAGNPANFFQQQQQQQQNLRQFFAKNSSLMPDEPRQGVVTPAGQQQSPEQCSEAVSELSSRAQNAGGGRFREISSSLSAKQQRRGSESFLPIHLTKAAPSDLEFTPKREANLVATTAATAGHINKIIAISPYQKGQHDSSNQKRIFTRPKNRMLASTAPAYRPNVAINFPSHNFLQQPLPDEAHEFNPIREGRQMSRLFEEEGSAGNNSSLPINDVTLQPTSRAFSTTGMRHDESSQVDQDNNLYLKRGARFHASVSQSVAGDGLAMMQHDESMELLDDHDDHFFAPNEQPKKQIGAFERTSSSGDEQGLRVVCENPDSSDVHQSLRQRGRQKTVLVNDAVMLDRPSRDDNNILTRTRLHSNFTSIDNRRFSQKGDRRRTDTLVVDTNVHQNTMNSFGECSQTVMQVKFEPRIKRQAQSIINKTRSERINMQKQSGDGGDDWQDNRSNFVHKPASQSHCKTCQERKFRKESAFKHKISLQNQQERSVQLNRTVQIMRFANNDHHKGEVNPEMKSSLSARMHCATSSYSSHRFEFIGSDLASKSDNKQDDDHSIGEEMIQGGDQEVFRKNALSKPSDPLNTVEKQRAHHVEKEVKDQMRRYESPRRNYQGQQSYRRNHHHHHLNYDSNHQTISPSESRQKYLPTQHHTSKRLQEKQSKYKSRELDHSSNVSYFSSTRFPKAKLYNQQSRAGGANEHSSRRLRSRSRSRLRSRSYSHSRSRSSSQHRITKRHTQPMRNLNLQQKDSQSAVGTSSYRSNTGRQKDNNQSYRRQSTMIVEGDSRRRLSKNHYRENRSGRSSQRRGGDNTQQHRRIDHYSSNHSRRSRRHDDYRDVYNQERNSSVHRHHQHNNFSSQLRMTLKSNNNNKSFFFQDNSRIMKQNSTLARHHHNHHHHEHYHDTKDAFYSKKHQQQKNHRRYECSSRGKGSFKTQNERIYRNRRSRSRGLSSFSSRGGHSLISSYSRGPPISSFKQSKKYPSQHSTQSPAANNNGTAGVTAAVGGVGGAEPDRSKDAGHFEWRKNMILSSQDPVLGLSAQAKQASRYVVIDHLGDGTFGRALKCGELQPNQQINEGSQFATDQLPAYAVKVVRAVPRYAESAKFEASILQDLQRQGGCERGIVYLKETFMNNSRQSYGCVSNMCLVFEPLGKSLYDFIKDNGYKGFEISQVFEIAIQSLQAIEFLHSIKLTHTDLKPENILLKDDAKETITDESQFPIQVQSKRNIYGSQKCSEVDSASYFSGQSQQVRRKWHKPTSCEVKVIDFGGATYEHERHTLIINTRQYRAPEVILENYTWNEKSDIWSMACILIELYTGELFFDTDENLEHLAMIEKQCGPIPLGMAQRCSNDQLKRQLHREGTPEEEQYVRNKKMRLRWPAASLRQSSRQAVSNMLMLDDIIYDKWGEKHRMFKDLLKYMLKIDPKERPSATDCLNHHFFSDIRKLSKSTEKTQVSTADHQFESPNPKNHNIGAATQ